MRAVQGRESPGTRVQVEVDRRLVDALCSPGPRRHNVSLRTASGIWPKFEMTVDINTCTASRVPYLLSPPISVR